MKKALVTVFVLLGVSTMAHATERHTFSGHIAIDGLWVDVCVVEYGEVNCSDWARRTAANALCRKKGYEKSTGVLSWLDDGGGHTTYRLTYFRRNGENRSEWRSCNGCGVHFTKVTCEKD